MSKCEVCIKLATEMAALKSERNKLRSSLASTSKRLKSYEGAVTKAHVDRLIDKSDRMHKRLTAAVARAEERFKSSERNSKHLWASLEDMRRSRDDLFMEIANKDNIIRSQARVIAEGTGRMDKKAVLLLRRVYKHLSNPKTGVPFKGAEALCKEIDRALVDA